MWYLWMLTIPNLSNCNSGASMLPACHGVDETKLFYTGLNGPSTVVEEADVVTKPTTKLWTAESASYRAAPLSSGGFAIFTGSWAQYPQISRLDMGKTTVIHSLLRGLRKDLAQV
ncbi:hypothetical protein BDBG_16047 [Blastomyces gilchristii SLH14081]|uniref:Uncharacterized protein n=1 Tax=Blastomyces gilchristii (strain SLH14081) TaxID=559298 RepID=A0A179U8M9_BLAGS|nr:uncharacterized protein BDBG_16047 [Blastomyces gilchristii SLH14081]OAT03351.1 hypothetical protein BDBG_16047 [Blastomyces gilchristii SLH14081]